MDALLSSLRSPRTHAFFLDSQRQLNGFRNAARMSPRIREKSEATHLHGGDCNSSLLESQLSFPAQSTAIRLIDSYASLVRIGNACSRDHAASPVVRVPYPGPLHELWALLAVLWPTKNTLMTRSAQRKYLMTFLLRSPALL